MSFMLSIVLFLPLVGGTAVLFLRGTPERCRRLSLGIALVELALVFSLLFLTETMPGASDGRRLFVDVAWVPSLGIRYFLVLDGISLSLMLLTAFLLVLCVLASWRGVNEKTGVFHFILLSAETATMGVFLAGDLFLFYLFWELQLIPIFFLIGLWGHANRMRAAIKFFLFSMAGSLFMLIAIIGLYVVQGDPAQVHGFAHFQAVESLFGPTIEYWLFGAFLLGIAVKIPLIPIHTWLPDAHTEAPTAGSIILAGLFLKTGAYALLRFGFPLFPAAARDAVPLLLILGLAAIIYIAWIAFAQQNMKRLVAYSSIVHMGLIIVGVALWNEIALTGAVVHMINHGVTISALFILVGILEGRTRSHALADHGGLWARMPVFSGFFLLFAMAALGLPGLNHFVGEILILRGALIEWPVVGIIGFLGIVLTRVYILKLIGGILFGPVRENMPDTVDITRREAAILIPLALVVLWIGLHPGPLFDLLAPAVEHLTKQIPGDLIGQTIMPTGSM